MVGIYNVISEVNPVSGFYDDLKPFKPFGFTAATLVVPLI